MNCSPVGHLSLFPGCFQDVCFQQFLWCICAWISWVYSVSALLSSPGRILAIISADDFKALHSFSYLSMSPITQPGNFSSALFCCSDWIICIDLLSLSSSTCYCVYPARFLKIQLEHFSVLILSPGFPVIYFSTDNFYFNTYFKSVIVHLNFSIIASFRSMMAATDCLFPWQPFSWFHMLNNLECLIGILSITWWNTTKSYGVCWHFCFIK